MNTDVVRFIHIYFDCTPKNKVTTHDNSNLNSSCVAKFGSNWNNTTNTGAFQLNVNNTSSNSNANISGHLLFSVFSFLHGFNPFWVENKGVVRYRHHLVKH